MAGNIMKNLYNWKAQREKNAFLALENGTVLRGYSVGADVDAVGEVVFNTGMTGYEEIVTDPSYAGQFVAMTCPEIGNYGFVREDVESRRLFLNGLIVRDMNPASNWRADSEFSAVLKKNGVPAIAGIDTRLLTLLIRENGTLKAYLHCSDRKISEKYGIAQAMEWDGLDNEDYASRVTCRKTYEWDPDSLLSRSWDGSSELPEADLHVVAYDFGIKWNILRCLRRHGMRVTVVPAKTAAEKVLKMKPDGVFLSNGPADPAAVTYAVEAARDLIGKVPLMGICLGHQILGIACGGERYRLKFGHHGCNHPVKNLLSGSVEITSQNHNFALKADSLPGELELTHINLNDNTAEGFRHRTEPMFSVQYHPEAAPGPCDPLYLFQEFRRLMGR